MVNPKVFFKPTINKSITEISADARELLEKVISEKGINFEKSIAIKVHTGQPGNETFIRPNYLNGVIDYLEASGGKPYFVETNMVSGPRSKESTHRTVAKEHGFNRIPLVIADGEEGNEDTTISVTHGKHFNSARIASKLADQKQVIVMSHFKGHIATGFAGAIKMLGIGFASRNGKMDVHLNNYTSETKTIDWNKQENLYWGEALSQRVAEYALAAANKKTCIYINFALNITDNCDCDGKVMQPLYKDIGVFASIDPVAIDKACFDLLKDSVGKIPFSGAGIFNYAELIGLGSQTYTLQTC